MSNLNTSNMRMRMLEIATKFLLPGLLLINWACAQPGSNPNEIRKAYEEYNGAFEKNDVDAILSFYTDDAVRLPADGSIVSGIKTIGDSMKVFREQNDYVLDEYSPAEIQISGDLAVTYSTFDEHWTSKATGETKREVGRWLVVWARQSDGSWKISKEMWTAEQK